MATLPNGEKPYLMGRHFKVKTDHDSLKYFLEQILSSKEQQKWVTKMLGYDFEIIIKMLHISKLHGCKCDYNKFIIDLRITTKIDKNAMH